MQVLILAGGVGGSRMADGLARVLGPSLTVVVNTGDDFDHYGLRICPDLDTVLYTLAGVGNPRQGWGVAGESYACLEMLERYGEEAWFRLGDRDLATHLLRHERLQRGMRLTEVTAELASRLGIAARVLPMCDEPVATWVDTELGEMSFQDYFVRHRHVPAVRAVEFRGIESARLSPEVRRAVSCAELVVLAPSNPFVSLLPILSVPGMREALLAKPLAAVSPLVGGQAVKGPAAAMLASLGYPVDAAGVVHALDLPGGLLVTDEDVEAPGWDKLVCPTLIPDGPAREALARRILERVARSG